MITDYWTVAFAIVVYGIQVDFTEPPKQQRIRILRKLFTGETNSTLVNPERLVYKKSVS